MRHTYKITTHGIDDPDVLTRWVLVPRNKDERKPDIGYEMIRLDDTSVPADGYPVTDLGQDLMRNLADRGERLLYLHNDITELVLCRGCPRT